MKKLLAVLLASTFIASPAFADKSHERWVREHKSNDYRAVRIVNGQHIKYPKHWSQEVHVDRHWNGRTHSHLHMRPNYYNVRIPQHYHHRNDDVRKVVQVVIGAAIIADALED